MLKLFVSLFILGNLGPEPLPLYFPFLKTLSERASDRDIFLTYKSHNLLADTMLAGAGSVKLTKMEGVPSSQMAEKTSTVGN